MKVLIREAHFVDRFTCNDVYREHFVTRAEEHGDMIQLYKGDFTYMCIPKNDIIILK